MKPNHNGAKNGGGYWGTRKEAKTISKKVRRGVDKKEINPYKNMTIGQVIEELATKKDNGPQLSQNLKDNISPCCFSTLEFIPNKTYKRCRTCGTCYEAKT